MTAKKPDGSMKGLVVTTGNFPHRRRTSCCGRSARVGESVIVLPLREQEGLLKRHVILHRRCMAALVETLPLDAQDYNTQFKKIRDRVAERLSVEDEERDRGKRNRVRR